MQTSKKGNALFTNWEKKVFGCSCIEWNCQNNVGRRFLVKRGKGTFTWRNLADKAFLNQKIKLTSSISYCEHQLASVPPEHLTGI